MKILITDDHILFREGLSSLINTQSDLTVIGSAATVKDSISQATTLQPDLILMDFDLPDGTGLDAARTILEQNPHVKLVFLTMNEADQSLSEAMRCGAHGYLPKNVPVNKLLTYIRGFEQGKSTRTPSKISS